MSGRRTALNWLGEHGFRCVDGDEVRAAECGLAGEAPMATIAQDGNELERMSDISMSFILAIDAPHGVRWRRQMASGGGSLEDFVKKSDSLMYDCDQVRILPSFVMKRGKMEYRGQKKFVFYVLLRKVLLCEPG